MRIDHADRAAGNSHNGTGHDRFALAAEEICQGERNDHTQRCGNSADNSQRPLKLSAVGYSIVAHRISKHGCTEIVKGNILDHAPELVEEKEHHHNDPVAILEAYSGLLPNRQRGLVLAFPLSQRFFGDPLPGEEIFDQNTDQGDQDQRDGKDLPMVVRRLRVIDRRAGFVDVILDLPLIIEDGYTRAAHIIDKQQLQEKREYHTAKAHGCQHSGVGARGEKAPVLAVSCGQAYQ